MRVAKYYHSMGYKRNEIERLLEEFLLRCDPTITLPRWRQAISRCASGAGKYPLIDVRGVTISQREMEQIGRLGGRLAQRLMFTLLCLAKYGNAVNPRNGNWVNRSPREVFALANITVTVNRQSLMINDLWREGYVGYSNIVDNINLNVKILDTEEEDVSVFISDFRNLGNQYMQLVGENYMTCQNCGVVVRKTSNRQKYCQACAVELNAQAAADNRREMIA